MSKACCPTPQSCGKSGHGKSLPKTCDTTCALAFVPMYHDCMHTIDSMFDVHSDDHKQDGKVRATGDYWRSATANSGANLVDLISS